MVGRDGTLQEHVKWWEEMVHYRNTRRGGKRWPTIGTREVVGRDGTLKEHVKWWEEMAHYTNT